MSKYDLLYNEMGGAPDYNDKTKYGRVLKWYAPFKALPRPLAARKQLAGEILERLIRAEVYYVQKVQVRNAQATSWRDDLFITYNDEDKICVYIDAI